MLYITTVADCKSVTAAAKKLYISQPSLSHIISKVEQDTGVKLFDRGTAPISLTYAGEIYVETARRILMMNENLRRELVDVGLGDKGRISFGMPTERVGYMLPKVVKDFKRQYPHMELQIIEANTDELIQALVKGEIQFLVAPRDSASLPVGLKTERIYQERLLLVMSPDLVTPELMDVVEQKADGLPKIQLGCLKHLPFIILKKGHAIRKKVRGIFKEYEMNPDIIMEVSSCISAVQLADSGLGVTIVPERALDSLGGRERFTCFDYSDVPECWDVNAIYEEGIYLGKPERFMIELLKQKFGIRKMG